MSNRKSTRLYSNTIANFQAQQSACHPWMTWFQGRFVIENPRNVGYRGRDNLTLYGGFHKWGIPKLVVWFIREYPFKMDDFGVPSKATYIISHYIPI